MRRREEVRAIPLWINGRAYLTLAPAFRDIRSPVDAEVLRKVPLCGAEEADEAMQSARAGLAGWLGLGESRRKQLLAALGDALQELSAHFSRMIAEETGMTDAQAAAEVAKIVEFLRNPLLGDVAGVVVLSGARLDAARQAASVLAGGGSVIVCPALESPSAFFALAELSGRCGIPAGVINILYMSDEALADLRMVPDVTFLP